MTRAPIRIRRSRTKGSRLPPGTICVTRPGIFGNPWKPGEPGIMVVGDRFFGAYFEAHLAHDMTAEDCVNLYRQMLDGAEIDATWFPSCLNASGVSITHEWLAYLRGAVRLALPRLRGKDLACWCKLDCACHADELLRRANK